MTADDPRDDKASRGDELGPEELEAAWRDIVAHYGDGPEVDGPEVGPEAPDATDGDEPEADRPESPFGSVLDRSYLDALDSSDDLDADAERGRERPQPSQEAESPAGDDDDRRWRDEEEHYLPPPPPPLPTPTPLRRAAWIALCVPPVLMLAAVVLGWTFPAWFSLLLVGGFIGGFLALVATMPRDRGEGWDDGAVV